MDCIVKIKIFYVGVWGLLCIGCLGACNKRLQCATYREVETISVAEDDYDPTANGYLRVKRSRATNLVRKKELSKQRAKRSKQMQTDKPFLKDPNLFYDKKDKNVKHRKAKNNQPPKEDCQNPPCPQGRK